MMETLFRWLTTHTSMDVTTAFDSLRKTIESSASAETVHATPIERANRTVVPIARVDYGLGGGDVGGGGGGGGATDAGGGGGGTDDNDDGAGGGLGGGLSVHPAGAIEVTDEGTRIVTPGEQRRPVAIVLLGIGCGYVVGRLLGKFDIDR